MSNSCSLCLLSGTPALIHRTGTAQGGKDFFLLRKISKGTMVLYRTICYCPSISASNVQTNELPEVPLLPHPPHETKFSFHSSPFAIVMV